MSTLLTSLFKISTVNITNTLYAHRFPIIFTYNFEILAHMFSTNNGVAIFLCLFILACNTKKQAPPKDNKDKPVNVEIIIAQPANINKVIEANGTAIASEAASLYSEVSGRLIYLNIPEGTVVQKGTIIAKVNNADLLAQLQKSKVALQLASQNEQRLKKLLSIEGVNQADYDAILNQVNGLKADIAYTEALLEKTILRAPFTGTIGLRNISNGAFITPATLIATLQQENNVKIDFTIPEANAYAIALNNKVQVEVNHGVLDTLLATIIAVEPQVNTTTRNLKVRAALPTGSLVTAGSFVKVMVQQSSKNNSQSILVPSNAIIPDSKAKKMVLVKQGKAQFVNVKTGERQAGATEIISGLSIGDSVVVSGVLFAKPNATLNVKAVKEIAKIIN